MLKRYKDFIIESKEDRGNIWTYYGNFRVEESMIINGKFIKDKIPDIVVGDFYCSHKELISLKDGPVKIRGFFNCSFNKLTSLEGGPKEVGSFNISNNQLKTLKGSPNKIGGDFHCSFNKLTSLEGICNKIEGYAYSDLKLEQNFINNGFYKDNYWNDLLKYMVNKKIDLQEVKGWPKGFLTDETIKSAKGLSKFNL